MLANGRVESMGISSTLLHHMFDPLEQNKVRHIHTHTHTHMLVGLSRDVNFFIFSMILGGKWSRTKLGRNVYVCAYMHAYIHAYKYTFCTESRMGEGPSESLTT
jgi:hypothetical protein